VSDHRDFQLELRIGGELVRLSARVPEAPMSLADFLPVVRSFADLVAQAGAREAETLGRPVRCGPGCGACCRQLVPISPAEALGLRRTLDGLAPEHRERVLWRFAELRERLAAAGLSARLLAACGRPRGESNGNLPRPELALGRELGLAYFALELACPFLESESCSIHPERPLACREYLVSSDPVGCRHPDAESVAVIDLPRRISVSFSRLVAELVPAAPAWLPLTLALDDSALDTDTLETATRPGPALFDAWIALLAGAPAPIAPSTSQASP
jgi:Fe-S-cluster containining protein